jgi:hypothetical protein
MGEHREFMEQMRMSRSDYLSALRKEQPIEELRRKAAKSARLKGRLWTQEQCDLSVAEASELLMKFVACQMASD